MPQPILVPAPSQQEEMRLLAESVSDLHWTVSTIIENSGELIPGESVEDLASLWPSAEGAFKGLVDRLVAPQTLTPADSLFAELQTNQLTGAGGKVKRRMLARLRDRFMSFWRALPRTNDDRRRAAEAGSEYVEFGATILNSIPGCHALEELLLLLKQLLSARARRAATGDGI